MKLKPGLIYVFLAAGTAAVIALGSEDAGGDEHSTAVLPRQSSEASAELTGRMILEELGATN